LAYIFLDESGDLGFKKTSSKWMVFAIALIGNKRLLEKVIVTVRKELKKKHKKLNELHANRADYVTRKRMFNQLAHVPGLQVLCVMLNKSKVHIDFENQKNYLYTYAVNILLENLLTKNLISLREPIQIFIDRKDTNKNIRDNFVAHLKKSLAKKSRNRSLEIRLEMSHDEKALQAVDFLSWAIFRKYESGDFEFYEMIKKLIVQEDVLFP